VRGEQANFRGERNRKVVTGHPSRLCEKWLPGTCSPGSVPAVARKRARTPKVVSGTIRTGMFNVISMTVMERTAEIGTLRACGDGRFEIALGHVLEAALGLLGGVMGLLAGWALATGALRAGVSMPPRAGHHAQLPHPHRTRGARRTPGPHTLRRDRYRRLPAPRLARHSPPHRQGPAARVTGAWSRNVTSNRSAVARRGDAREPNAGSSGPEMPGRSLRK